MARVQRRNHILVPLIQASAALDSVRCTPLAAVSAEVIRTLLDRGVTVNELREENGATPLHFAAVGEFKSAVLDLLVNTCACDVNARDSLGNSSAHLSAMYGDVLQLQWLLGNGADVDAVSDHGLTLLHCACNASSDLCVLLSLAAGVDVHARATNGDTAADVAASPPKFHVQMAIVHLLVAAGADLDAVNRSGYSPRQILSRGGKCVDVAEVAFARQRIAAQQLEFVRERAMQVCIGLQSRGLDALVMCEILVNACGPVAPQVAFHQWWKIATGVKHFQ